MKVLHSSWHELKPTAEDAASEPRNTKAKLIFSKCWAKACNSSHANTQSKQTAGNTNFSDTIRQDFTHQWAVVNVMVTERVGLAAQGA